MDDGAKHAHRHKHCIGTTGSIANKKLVNDEITIVPIKFLIKNASVKGSDAI